MIDASSTVGISQNPAGVVTLLRVTDQLVSKDCPPALAALGYRVGGRPIVARQYPCVQLTDTEDSAAQMAILTSVRRWPGVRELAPRQSIPGCRALVLDETHARGQGEAFILGREFAHVRGDGSVHTALAPEWAEDVLRKGWGQIHPLALYGLIQPQSLIFYAPRDEREHEATVTILAAAYSYACGRLAVPAP